MERGDCDSAMDGDGMCKQNPNGVGDGKEYSRQLHMWVRVRYVGIEPKLLSLAFR